MLPKILISVAAFAVGVYAQTSSAAGSIPTSTGQLDACILNCTSNAAVSTGCVSVTNVTCVCTSAAFSAAATQCLTSLCTPADLQTTLQLQKAECAGVTGGNSTTANSTTSSTAPSGPSPTNGSTSPAAPPTSAGVAQELTLSFTHMIGLAGALAGSMTGFGLLL